MKFTAVTGVSESDAPWVDVVGGQRRLVHADVDRGVWALGVRYEPGSGTERHHHTGEVFGWTLSGRWQYTEYLDDYTLGTFVHEKAGETHTLVVPADNSQITEVFFVVHGANLMLDADDRITRVVDAGSISERYRSLCVAQGKSVPSFLGGHS